MRKAQLLGRCDSEPKLVRAQRLAVYIEMKRIKAKPTIIEMKIYLFD